MTYVYFLKDFRPLDEEAIKLHVEHLKDMDEKGSLVLCGPFSEGGGMVAFRAQSLSEAKKVAESDPFISMGYKTYELRSLQVADKSNEYLAKKE